jgi:hypothetical protein
MENLTIPFIVLAIMFVAVVIGWSETWKKKEHYRCRVFELSKGKEGSNLVVVEPTTPPPPPPKKPRVRLCDDWKFINLETCGDQSCLDRLTAKVQKDGYKYIEKAAPQTILAFHKLWTEEIKEEEK